MIALPWAPHGRRASKRSLSVPGIVTGSSRRTFESAASRNKPDRLKLAELRAESAGRRDNKLLAEELHEAGERQRLAVVRPVYSNSGTRTPLQLSKQASSLLKQKGPETLERNQARLTHVRAISASKIERLKVTLQDTLQRSGPKLLESLHQTPMREPAHPDFVPSGRAGAKYCDDSLDAIFFHRINAAWTCLLTPSRRAFAVHRRTIHDKIWIARIIDCIPMEVRALLVNDRCPTYNDLMTLPKVKTVGMDSCNAGVYAWLTKSRYTTKTASDRLVCVGAAHTGSGRGGLIGTVNRHQDAELPYFAPRRQTLEEKRAATWSTDFVPLMEIELCRSTAWDPPHLPTMVDITQAILAVWLGGTPNPSLRLGRAFPRDYHDKMDYSVVVP